jgi:BirA family transcriptional regulator, biotin operon repressor / biotin---[acetyl-CoA-carboxylase] ligase
MAVPATGDLEPPPLLRLLADGEVHSGERLAQALGHSRAAVWKAVARLREHGIAVNAIPRRGYQLPDSVELLDADAIRAGIAAAQRPRLRALELLFEVDSTNSRLLERAAPPPGAGDACLCELQYAGRGRLGRRWVAPFGSGLALSLAWTFSDAARSLPALSLGVGVAVVRALNRAGARGIGLKWPNDIWFEDAKLGGVLIELRAEAGGPAHVVIGVGLNLHLPPAARAELDALGVQVTAASAAAASQPSRNMVAGAILDELLSMLLAYERHGFAAFRDAWTALDALGGRPAQICVGDRIVTGVARGVDQEGALLLESDNRVQRFVSGEASLRLTRGSD